MIGDERQDRRLPEGDYRKIPRFSDIDAIIDMFLEEDMRDWSADWPKFEEPMTLKQALEKAKLGEAADLIRIVEGTMLEKKKKRGRPKISAAKRVRAAPIHRAASMVRTAELILAAWYPDQLRKDIRSTASEVVAEMWHHFTSESLKPKEMDPTAEKLLNYLDRPKRDRRRIA